MPGSPIKIGPFTNGLNTYSDPTTIEDTECVELINFDIDLDGSIVSRPPVVSMAGSALVGSARVLGTFTSSIGTVYLIVQDNSPNLRAFDVLGNTWSVVKAGITATATVQYANKLWVVASPTSGIGGGSWDPVGGWTDVASMPRGISAAVYRERMFVATGPGMSSPSRLNFSGAANFGSWTSTDFVDANNGDGQVILKLYVFSGQIVIFKSGSTYTYGYDSSPTKGVVQNQSNTIGIAGPDALADNENIMYVLYNDKLYSIQNWHWDQINVKVPLRFYSYAVKTSFDDYSLSLVGDRLIARYFDNFYVYGIKTRAFSLWRFNKAGLYPHQFFKFPKQDPITTLPIYFATCYRNGTSQFFKFVDSRVGSVAEDFDCSLITKTYDYNVPYSFKRLLHWGVDCLGKTSIDFEVDPTVYNVPVKWSQLKGLKWSTLNSWRAPIAANVNVTDSATLNNPAGVRTYIKLLKSLRFRQISFKVSTSVDGTLQTGPFRIFSLTAFTSNKQLVSKKVS